MVLCHARLMPTDALFFSLGSWIGDTAHLAARLQSENGGLLSAMSRSF